MKEALTRMEAVVDLLRLPGGVEREGAHIGQPEQVGTYIKRRFAHRSPRETAKIVERLKKKGICGRSTAYTVIAELKKTGTLIKTGTGQLGRGPNFCT